MSAIDEPRDPAEAWKERSEEIDRLRTQGLWLPGATTALQVLGKVWDERSHQAYIAWLLTPTAEHQLCTRLLAAMLNDLTSVQVPTEQLFSARVRTEVIRPQSRADIVVAMRDLTLVIELKTQSTEGVQQTPRLADDFVDWPNPVMVLLSYDGDVPLSTSFHSKDFRWLIECVRTALQGAAKPHGTAAIQARATAFDYLITIERLYGVGQVNQHAAAFWMRHWCEMKEAERAAIRVLELLPERVEHSLRALAPELGEDVRVMRCNYSANAKNYYYPVDAVLLHRTSWLASDNKLRFGIGYGRRDYPQADLDH